MRLEGRINRSKENHEGVLNWMKSEQAKFQSEIRSTISGLQIPPELQLSQHNGSTSRVGPLFGGMNGDHGSGGHTGLGSIAGPGAEGMGGGSNWYYRKIDMPLFDGNSPDGCILRVERYFAFYCLSEEEKLEAAVVAMEGESLQWYQWEHKRRPIQVWVELKELILQQFRPVNVGSLCEQWLATVQTIIVVEYRQKFIEMVAPLDDVPENILMSQFINGLKEGIKAELRLLNPLNLEQAIELAIRVEERNRVNGYNNIGPNALRTGSYSIYNKSPTTTTLTN